jgi:prefoldin alpha subunit
MQGTAETLQQRLAILQNAMTDLTVARESINALNELKEGAPILIPTGGGTFVNANLGDLKRILVNIGADVSVEMNLEEAMQDVSNRLDEVQKSNQSVQQQLQEILTQLEIRRNTLQRLSVAIRGETPGV